MNLDIIIIIIYILLMNAIGLKYSGSASSKEYFLGNKKISWLLSSLSIVATETSSLTFISIPGLAYVTGTGFIQVAFGYLIGRILVAYVLLPKYFEGNLETAYEFLQNKFSPVTRKTASVIFHVTRILADGVRLFATAIPLALLMNWDYKTSIIIIGISSLIYTIYGGIKAVAVVDAIQLAIYIFSGITGIYFISLISGNSLVALFKMIPDNLIVFYSSGFAVPGEFFKGYNVFSGIIGGSLLSFASHGTDHLIVQRLLACRDLKSSQKSIISSGVIIIFQFMLFLFWGLLLNVLFNGKVFSRSDEIMPYFIINYLPEGIRGLMLAGIFAAAMSTLSSTINALSSSTVYDLIDIENRIKNEKKRVVVSRIVSFFWAFVLIIIALMIKESKSPLVELGLGIASITYGGMAGMFIFGRFFKNFSDKAAIAGAAISIVSVYFISESLKIFWPWYVPAGLIISLVSSILISYILKFFKKES